MQRPTCLRCDAQAEWWDWCTAALHEVSINKKDATEKILEDYTAVASKHAMLFMEDAWLFEPPADTD